MEKKNETYCWSQATLEDFYNKAYNGSVVVFRFFLDICLQKLFAEAPTQGLDGAAPGSPTDKGDHSSGTAIKMPLPSIATARWSLFSFAAVSPSVQMTRV